jgi:hypothetical protein
MHTEQDLQQAIALLKEELETHRGNYITGSKVGEILINHCQFRLKNLEHPKLTLSKLISTYLSGVLSADAKKGGDTLYFVGEGGEPLTVDPDYRYWLAFAKPDEPSQFGISATDKQPVLVTSDGALPAVRIVPKAVLDDLEVIKQSFITSHLTPGEVALPERSIPYLQWVAEVRELPGQQMHAWSRYRIEQLKELFALRLTKMDIEPGDQARLINFLSESQCSKPRALPASENNISRHHAVSKLGQRNDQNSDQVFRDAVVEVISQLSMADLRELKLPAGLLMDALQNRS